MKAGIGYQLKAWGRHELPRSLRLNQMDYRFIRVFKHDFFAATLLFKKSYNKTRIKEAPHQIVLKLGRRADFLGIPFGWLGRALIGHEISILRYLQQIPAVPQLLGGYGKWGLIYEYIPGKSLDQRPIIPNEFFDRLEKLIKQIHQCRIAYVDMNKQGNILLGEDGLPRMIDFQIAWHIPHRVLGCKRIAHFILDLLQQEDRYHFYKHKRRLRRDLMDDKELEKSRRISGWIALHRAGTRPLTKLRRRILGYLFKRGHLMTNESVPHSSETDPTRWMK